MCCSCLYKVSKKTCKIIGIVTITIASLFVLLVVVVPILARKSFASGYIEKSNPTKDNTNLWGKFPGDLKTTLTHNFTFFDYDAAKEENKYNIFVKKSIILDGSINYDKFKEDQETKSIFFYNNRTYTTKQNASGTTFDSINLGMFEALETMAYPPVHKLGINSIFYLTKKYFLESDLFIKELFSYSFLKQHSIDDIKEKILINIIPKEIIEKILDNKNEPYKTYSLGTKSGFFEWIKILGSTEKVQNAEWLKKIFTLNDTQINSTLLNDNCYLMQNYKEYKTNISNKFKCTDESKCSKELLYKQLINSEVISKEIPQIKAYKELNDYLEIDIYPFSKTPEMKDYFKSVYIEKYKDKTSYEQVSVTEDQLKKFLEEDGKYHLLKLKNSIDILHKNKTEDPTKETKYFDDLNYAQVNFLTEYFYSFLPSIFLYPTINIDEKVEENDPKSYGLLGKAVSNFLPKIAEETYNKISKVDLVTFLDKRLSFVYLKTLLHNVELEEICPIIYQKVLDDGKKVYQICSDDRINLMNQESFYKYYQFYYCQKETFDISKCDNGLKEILQNIKGLYITEKEISGLVTKDSPIGQTIQNYKKNMSEHYKCPGECTNEYLLRIQFAKANVTKNPPPPMIGEKGLKDWFSEIGDYYEIINILEKYNQSLDFEEQDAFYIIDSIITKGELYDIDNSKIFKNKINFETNYMKGLINNKAKGDHSSLANLTNFLMGIYIFNTTKNEDNKLTVPYNTIDDFLEGHRENNYWLKILKNGSYFENYNPGMKKLTKFEVDYNFETGKQENLDFDYIGISTDTENFYKRRMTKMNDLLTLNIKKTEFDNVDKSEVKLAIPLYNFEKLLDQRLFSDGFQYDHKLDVIYYFDQISSRPLVFGKPSNKYYKDRIECKKYILDNDDPTSGINEIFDRDSNKLLMVQKSNKPFMIDADYAANLKKFGIETEEEIQNFICVDPVSDMVVESKLNFAYSLYARKYGLIHKGIEIDGVYPLFIYRRDFDVDLNSYDEVYPGAADYYEDNFSFLVIGVLIVIFFSTFALVAFNVVYNQDKEAKKDMTKLIGEELGEGTEKLKSDADPDADNEALKLKVENDSENKNENKNEDENENLIK